MRASLKTIAPRSWAPVCRRLCSAPCPFADIVRQTAPVVSPKARDIAADFYPRLFANNPETRALFNPANQLGDAPSQHAALANAIIAYASNIDALENLGPAVAAINHKHCGLNVLPEHYPIVHDNLMASIGHVLGDSVTPEIGTAWSEAVLALASIFIGEEEKLYTMAERRRGGWRGVRDFKIARARPVSDECLELTFEPAYGGYGRPGQFLPIDFTPGQFLTLHLKTEGATPRHYTITNAPGKPYLQCCVKRVEGGFVSGAVHSAETGEVVGLSPPFGAFGLGERPAVFATAGIGATPMKALLDSAPDRVRLAVHVDRSAEAHPFREELAASGVPSSVHYTAGARRPSAGDLVAEMRQHLAECDVFLCGPAPFVSDMKGALTAEGVDPSRVHVDVFGPELASL